MTIAALLRQTVARYEAALHQVLEEWSPDCGCGDKDSSNQIRPGTHPRCATCPHVSRFESLVQQKITQLHAQKDGFPHLTQQTHDPTECIYVSESQV